MEQEKRREIKPKKTFFKTLISSIKDFEMYKEFATETLGTTIKYGIKLILLFAFFMAICITYNFVNMSNEAVLYFKNNIPDLSYENNLLTVNQTEPINIENTNFPGIIIIDTNAKDIETINSHTEKIKLYDNGILILKDKVILKNSTMAVLNTYEYKDIAERYGIGDFTKNQIISYIDNNNISYIYIIFFLISILYLFIIYLSYTLLDAILLAILAYIMSWMFRLKMKFSSSFGLAVHALTLPIILNLVYIIINTFTGFTIKYFDWMYSIVSYIYIVTALFIIRGNLIKQQLELTRIIGEQEKIRLELEEKKRKEEEERQKEEQKKEEKRKEKENKEKNKKDDELGGEPEGSKA